jgi:asparagine synthase (glutamine-hydrolysing)
MVAALAHRGPDDRGEWSAGPAALGARRLAVIDPAGSRQPLASEDGSLRLVFNGEIYNYLDLRRDLAARGHRLATAGDAEVVLHLYEDHGADCLGRLVGMFAFALWDAPRRRLLVARDRLGQKPLVWRHAGGEFAFASEPAALLAGPYVPRAVDAAAIGAFLRFGYVPAPRTGLEGVHKLPPAHLLEYDAAADAVIGPRRWWDIPRGPVEEGVPDGEWQERVVETLSEAVRSQLVSDVPLGVLLSGGIDSSAVAALAAAHSPGTLRTFTVRFDEPGWDESAYARAVAERLGTDHTEVHVRPRAVEALEVLVRRHGEPFADSSGVAVYALSQAVRREVTVALSGDGGDESFGGYPRHAAMWLSERMGPLVRGMLARVGRCMPAGAGRKSRWNALRRFLAPLDADPLPRYLAWRSLFTDADMHALLAPDFAAATPADDTPERWRELAAGLDERTWTDRAMALDTLDYLPNDCLAKVDIASMAHGLEVRGPMLDHRVVELARRMPERLKWRGRTGRTPLGKAVLRDAFAPALPPQVLARGKMGFGVPVGRWLAGEHAAWLRERLLDAGSRTREFVRREAVESLIAAHTSRRADHGDRLWALVCLELWLRAYAG